MDKCEDEEEHDSEHREREVGCVTAQVSVIADLGTTHRSRALTRKQSQGYLLDHPGLGNSGQHIRAKHLYQHWPEVRTFAMIRELKIVVRKGGRDVGIKKDKRATAVR